METNIKQELTRTYLIAEDKGTNKVDFRFKMLLSNNVKGMLTCTEHNIDDRVRIYYDITGKQSLKEYCEENGIKSELVRQIVTGLLNIEEECTEYLMNTENISLNTEHVFIENNKIFFCYLPWDNGEINERFHDLIIELMDYGDRNDKECMKLLYELHGLTRQNYNLDEVIAVITRENICLSEKKTERMTEKRQEIKNEEKETGRDFDEVREERYDVTNRPQEEMYFRQRPEPYVNNEYIAESMEDEDIFDSRKMLRSEKRKRREERREIREQKRREKKQRYLRDEEYENGFYDYEYDERFLPKRNEIYRADYDKNCDMIFGEVREDTDYDGRYQEYDTGYYHEYDRHRCNFH